MSRAMIRALNGESTLRGLTGQGEPGLHTLLGGTGTEGSALDFRMTGGGAQTSTASRLAEAYRDKRLGGGIGGTSTRVYDGSNDGERKPGDKTR